MKKKLLCLFSAALLVLASCSSDDTPQQDTTPSILVKKITEFVNNNPVPINFLYDGNKVVSVTYADGYKSKYTYTGDFITKLENIDEKGLPDGSEEYGYTNGKLTSFIEKGVNVTYDYKTKYVHNSDGTVSYTQFRINVSTGVEEEYGQTGKLTYKDGNLVKAERSIYGSASVEIYEYDTKNNPLKNVTGINLLLDDAESGVNNVTKITRTSGSGTNIYTYVTTYTYKYDANNYPTERIATFANGNSTSTETTQYAY